MSIDSVSSTSSLPTTSSSALTQARKDFTALASDLQSGNLAGAQQDFATLLQDAPQLQAASQGTAATTAATATTTSPTSAFSTLSAALQSGDLTGAQNALTSLQQSVKGLHHHHHHHHCDQDDASQAAGAAQSQAATATSAAGSATAATPTTSVTTA